MEQNRTPHVLSHYRKLARSAADRSCGDCELIGHTTTTAGFTIQAELDQGTYPTDIKVTDQQMQALSLQPADFHGQDWNYSIAPQFYTKPSSY